MDTTLRKRAKKIDMDKRVTGIGGLFFKSTNPDESKAWYKKHLGFDTDAYGCTFRWKDTHGKDCTTQWSPFDKDTKYFQPSEKEFMFNYRVENLIDLLEVLKEEGVTILGSLEEYSYGKFAWVEDNDGNKIELWEPIDAEFL